MTAKRALIVDDSRSARTILTRILQRYDLQVDGAASAEEAFEYLEAERPDVIFMDHLMPGMDGFQALSAIKNDPRTAAIPVMMYTSQEGEVYLNQARSLGAVGVLPKQMRADDVGRALQPLRLLGESGAMELVRATLAPVPVAAPAPAPESAAPVAAAPAAAAQDAESPLTAASDAAPINMSPELQAHFDALLRDHAIELRRYVAATLAQHTGQIISEVRALMDTTAPAASAATAGPAVAPVVVWPVSRRSRGGAAALWLALAAALIAVATGVFWYRAQLLEAGRAALASLPRVHAVAASQPPPATAASVSATAAPGLAAAPAPVAAIIAAMVRGGPAAAPAATRLVESVPFGEQPLGAARVARIRAMLEQLAAAGFRGTVEIRSFPGRFCMQSGGEPPQMPAADVPYAQCGRVGNPLDYAAPRSLQSPEFAALLAAQASRGQGAMDVQLAVGSAGEVATPYPLASAALTAGEWNRAAAANNRIEVRTRPTP
jgi:CheY-like chemotaxis protein